MHTDSGLFNGKYVRIERCEVFDLNTGEAKNTDYVLSFAPRSVGYLHRNEAFLRWRLKLILMVSSKTTVSIL